jgi:hypothetical protein
MCATLIRPTSAACLSSTALGQTTIRRSSPPRNSTPAWGYPFVATNLANTPGAKTLIDQGFAAQVLGAGAYAFLNDQRYLEADVYQTLNPGTLNSLGVNPTNTQPINGGAPYFRAAYERQ